MHRIKRCSWKGSRGTPASHGHQAEVPGALGAVFCCMVAAVQYTELLGWMLKARLDILFSVPEVAHVSLPIRALPVTDIPRFSLQHGRSKSHRQAWKASWVRARAFLQGRKSRGTSFPHGQKASLFKQNLEVAS